MIRIIFVKINSYYIIVSLFIAIRYRLFELIKLNNLRYEFYMSIDT